MAIGMVLGIAAFSYQVVNLLLDNYKIYRSLGLAGAIIGTIPSLIKESVKESDQRSELILLPSGLVSSCQGSFFTR